MPPELLLLLCTYMDHQDLQALAMTSHSLCDLLLPEYLRCRGLVLKDTFAGGAYVALHNLGGYVSLGLWSVVRNFCPPEDLYCSIPHDVREARSAMRLLICFLQEPSNTCSLQSFHIFLPGLDPYLLMHELCQIECLLYILPLRELCILGFYSANYFPLPPPYKVDGLLLLAPSRHLPSLPIMPLLLDWCNPQWAFSSTPLSRVS